MNSELFSRSRIMECIKDPKNRRRIIWTASIVLERMVVARYPNFPKLEYAKVKRTLKELCADNVLVQRPRLHTHFTLKETAYMRPGDVEGRRHGETKVFH